MVQVDLQIADAQKKASLDGIRCELDSPGQRGGRLLEYPAPEQEHSQLVERLNPSGTQFAGPLQALLGVTVLVQLRQNLGMQQVVGGIAFIPAHRILHGHQSLEVIPGPVSCQRLPIGIRP